MAYGVAPVVPLLAAAGVFVVPAVVMWLWNTTMPDVFGLRELRYWQAFRLILLAALLFAGLRIVP